MPSGPPQSAVEHRLHAGDHAAAARASRSRPRRASRRAPAGAVRRPAPEHADLLRGQLEAAGDVVERRRRRCSGSRPAARARCSATTCSAICSAVRYACPRTVRAVGVRRPQRRRPRAQRAVGDQVSGEPGGRRARRRARTRRPHPSTAPPCSPAASAAARTIGSSSSGPDVRRRHLVERPDALPAPSLHRGVGGGAALVRPEQLAQRVPDRVVRVALHPAARRRSRIALATRRPQRPAPARRRRNGRRRGTGTPAGPGGAVQLGRGRRPALGPAPSRPSRAPTITCVARERRAANAASRSSASVSDGRAGEVEAGAARTRSARRARARRRTRA